MLLATVVVAPSKTNAGSSPAGTAMAIGLVPSLGSRPKVGTILDCTAVEQVPIIPCGNASIAW